LAGDVRLELTATELIALAVSFYYSRS